MRIRGTVLVLSALAVCACDGSRDKLLADLQSARPDERALAVKKLAQQEKPDDLVLFTRAAKDLAAIVRAEAALALGKSQDPRVVDLLGELLEDQDAEVQAKAAVALAEIKGDKAKAYLTQQYGRQSRSTRIAIVQALKAANVPGAMAQVVAVEAKGIWDRNLRALTEGTPPERVAAAEELGKSGRAEAVNRLLPLVKDSQVILAAAAVRGLGYAGDHRAVGAIAALLTENFPQLREAASDALLRLQDPSALATLKAIASEKSATSSAATAAILAMPKTAETNEALCEIAFDAAPDDAGAAAREMRKRGGCPEVDVLARLAKAREPSNLISVLRGLVGLGPTAKAALPKVLTLLAHPDSQVSALALQAITEGGDASAAPAIQKIYEQELKTVRGLRAKWVTQPMPQVYAPGFDPSAPPPTAPNLLGLRPPGVPPAATSAGTAATADEKAPEAEGASQTKILDLMQRVRAMSAAKMEEKGKATLEVRPPTEVVDDVTEEQLRPLAGAIRALGTLQASGALDLLKPHLDDPSPAIRSAAAVGLAHLGADGIAVAKAALFDADHEVQNEVAQALAQQGEPGQAEVLRALPKLSDKLRLLEALHQAGLQPSAVPVLEGVLKEGGAESALAADLLGDLHSKTSVDALVRYLDDLTVVGRRNALLALGKIGDPKAAEVVAKDLNHDSPDVRAAAAEALSHIGSAAQLEALDALKGDYYRSVRESTELALSRVTASASESHK